MSRYDILRKELSNLKTRQAVAVMAPTAIMTTLIFFMTDTIEVGVLAGLATLCLLPLILHRLWRFAFPSYRAWSDRASQIGAEIAGLQKRIATIFDKYRKRQKGEHFKKAYDLTGRPVRDLEEALSVGMYRERREVFVTAFMRRGVAVRVTAAIGSPYRCSASDNPSSWRHHLERLGCDELRQYHNHSVHNGSTRPSSADVKTSQSLKDLLGPHKAKLRSLIICWNGLREWKVFEHDETGRHWLHFEFDVSV